MLMQTASELFARRGIDAVSLNEINRSAGQRNTSAMHYHFGSKEGLLQAIVYEHYADIDNQINAGLDAWEALPPAERTTRELLRTLVAPFSDQLTTTEGINYLLIVRQLLLKSSDMLFLGHPEGKDSARPRIFSMFLKITTDVPREVRPTRVVLGAGLIFNSLATYAQAAEAGDQLFSGSRELFVSNLLDNLEALLTSRPSEETLEILEG